MRRQPVSVRLFSSGRVLSHEALPGSPVSILAQSSAGTEFIDLHLLAFPGIG
jgi:hypothetical protein